MKLLYMTNNIHGRRSMDDIAFFKETFDKVTVVDTGKHSKNKINRIKGWLEVLLKFKDNDLVFGWECNKSVTLAVLLCKLFNRKSIVCVSGGEASDVKSVFFNNYQFGTKLKDKISSNLCFRYADVLLPVSKMVYDDINKHGWGNRFLLYASVDTDRFKPNPDIVKSDMVIFVGNVKWSNVYRKGLDVFVRCSHYLPDVDFVVVGKIFDNSVDYLKLLGNNNVRFTGWVSDNELLGFYQRAKVCCMFSFYEAFGSSLAETMSCGCIPVVTKSNVGLVEIVGDTGFLVDYGDLLGAVDMIKKGLSCDNDMMVECRNRIVDMFSIHLRLSQLRRIIEWVC